MKHSRTLALAGLGLTSLLTGCDGGTITYTPNSQANSSASSISSSSSSIDDCAIGTAGAPACYAITPSKEQCAIGNCEVEYTTADACGVKGLDAQFIFEGYDPSRCQPPEFDICSAINGRTYYTTTLEEGGSTPNGVSKMHWQASFKDGQLSLLQSDFGISGTYSCSNNQVIATLDNGSGNKEMIIELSEDTTQFKLDPLGTGELTYAYSEAKDTDSCRGVAGKTFSTPPAISNNLEDGPTLFEFSTAPNTVIYGYSDIRERGYYDCDLGQLHVHLESKPTPLLFDVNRHAFDITLLGEPNITLPQVTTPIACTAQYAPVCAAQTVQCVTTPCYPIHTTYSNQCVADAAKLHTLFEGECGDKEGQSFVEPTPTICPANIDPVCGKVKTNIQCITAPCPNSEYKTFNNSCEANANQAQISFKGLCSDVNLEQTVSFEQQPTRLYNVKSDATSPGPMPQDSGINIISATIRDDILMAKLGYSGCNEQPIFFNVDASILLASFPEQTSYTFSKTTEDLCQAYFETTFEYDLLPIRGNFPDQVEGKGGLIVTGELYQR